MSGARNAYRDAAERELSHWPGVGFRFETGGKHPRLVLSFGRGERFVVYPASPSDSRRGVRAFITDVRCELKLLGAQRTEKERRAAPRTPPRARVRRHTSLPTITDPRPDGFAELRALQERMKAQAQQPAPQPSSFVARILECFRRAA